MQTINLPCYAIVVEFDVGAGAGTIDPGKLSDSLFDGILSLVLGHACAGVDITTPAYIEGLETAIENVDLD